jgi:hypothetical protein
MLSEKILNGELATGQHVLIDFADNEFTAVMTGSILPTEEPVADVPAKAAKSAKVPADSDIDSNGADSGSDPSAE